MGQAGARRGVGRRGADGRCRFTLIELLVVIAIIGVVAGLALPALAGAKRKAHQAECISQLRQIGSAVHAYLSENDSRLPCCARLGPDPLMRLPSLRQCLESNLNDERIFHCPGDQPPNGLFAEFGTSYEWNTLVSGRLISQPTLTIVGMRIDAPLMGDAEDYHGPRRRNALFSDGRVVCNPEIRIQ